MAIRLVGEDGSEMILPISIRDQGRRLEVERPGVAVPGQTGFARSGIDRIRERSMRLIGTWWEPDPDYLRSRLHELRALLMSGVIQIFTDHTKPTYFVGELTESNQPWQTYGVEVEVDIALLLSDPFEYGSPGSASRENVVAPTDFVAQVGGNVPIYPQVRFTMNAAAGGGLRVENLDTGQTLRLNGNYAVGDELTVDVARFVALRNGSPVNRDMDNDFLFRGFQLLPGSNTLRASAGTSGYSFDVLVEWLERWF